MFAASKVGSCRFRRSTRPVRYHRSALRRSACLPPSRAAAGSANLASRWSSAQLGYTLKFRERRWSQALRAAQIRNRTPLTDRSRSCRNGRKNNRSPPCILGRGCLRTVDHRAAAPSSRRRNHPLRRSTTRRRLCPIANSKRVRPHNPSSHRMRPNSGRFRRQRRDYTRMHPLHIGSYRVHRPTRAGNRSTASRKMRRHRPRLRHHASCKNSMRGGTLSLRRHPDQSRRS